MAFWICRYHDRVLGQGSITRWNLDEKPAPTIMAGGIWGGNTSQYWLEDDGMPVTTTQQKPEYRVPSMAEIAAIEPNGYSMVSTFSGCGGSCLGFEMAGFNVRWASEFVPAAQEVYKLNHPGVILDTRDIREVAASDVLARLSLQAGQLDVLEGSPPCAAFSTAGKRHKTWGKERHYSDTHQQTDDLFYEYARLLRDLQPRVFVAENVSGLVKGVAKGYFLAILAELKAAGYEVEARLLDASWLGVPQSRQRLIFQGVRRDLYGATGLGPRWPKPLAYQYTIRDALPWLCGARTNTNSSYREVWIGTDSPSPTILASTKPPESLGPAARIVQGKGSNHSSVRGDNVPMDEPSQLVMALHPNQLEVHVSGRTGPQYTRAEHPLDAPIKTIGAHGEMQRFEVTTRRIKQGETVDEHTASSLDGYAVSAEWDKLQPGESSDKFFNLTKAHPDKPSPTVTGSGGQGGNVASVTHPYERRKFTIAELKRLCAFPDDFKLTGTYSQQWERLGRAVPPLMMRAIAREVRDLLKDIDMSMSGK